MCLTIKMHINFLMSYLEIFSFCFKMYFNFSCLFLLESPRKDLDSFEDFEVAMAISDLIFELNNVMDWNSKSPKNGNIVNSG